MSIKVLKIGRKEKKAQRPSPGPPSPRSWGAEEALESLLNRSNKRGGGGPSKCGVLEAKGKLCFKCEVK